MKRIVTGFDNSGKAAVLHSGSSARTIRLQSLPRLVFEELWATDGIPRIPDESTDPATLVESLVPGPGGTRFRCVTLPPDSEVAAALIDSPDPAAPIREIREKLPGFGEDMNPLDPAMHSTPTLDYGIVLSGDVWMELEGGDTVHLQPGDCVIQQGTRHAWRNRSDGPCVMAFIMIGASAALE